MNEKKQIFVLIIINTFNLLLQNAKIDFFFFFIELLLIINLNEIHELCSVMIVLNVNG